MMRFGLLVCSLAVCETVFGSVLRGRKGRINLEPGVAKPQFSVTVLRQFPHVDKPFTQGLEFMSDGMLVETSGAYPSGTASHVRILDPSTGEVVQQMDDEVSGLFVEGIARRPGGNWVVSTWEDKKIVEYDAHMRFVKEHNYPAEGWGLAHNIDGDDTLLATNGSSYLVTLKHSHEEGYQVVNETPITCEGREVTGMNELEMVKDFFGNGPALLGNIYMTRDVFAIDPKSGECFGSFSLNGLEDVRDAEIYGGHVANGIAYNEQTGTYIMTGKNWDNMYEVKIEKL